jgi:DNA-binding transcriptional MerR regulator
MDDGDPAAAGLTVGELARRGHITVRALHHYDAIGLLQPTGRSLAGYRLYSSADEDRLRAILAFRAAGVGLADIPALIVGERGELLARQIAAIDARMARLTEQRELLTRIKEWDGMGINLTPEEYYDVFGETDPAQHAEEVAERWGDTDMFEESRRRTAAYGPDEWRQAQTDAQNAVDAFIACLDSGLPPESEHAAAAADEHRAAISRWYYPCSVELQVALAEMYVADPRFRATYDNQRAGLADFISRAIIAAANR